MTLLQKLEERERRFRRQAEQYALKSISREYYTGIADGIIHAILSLKETKS